MTISSRVTVNATSSARNLAVSPLSAPNLPFGDINVVILTDVHSWVGGHGPKEVYDADYGDVLSFYERLKSHCDLNGMDLFFVVNGDWIDGTGLATNGDPSNLIPLLEKMPWDALNIGNHELYRNEIISYMTRPGGFVEWWGDKYLTSNIIMTETDQPIGKPYHILRGKNSTVLAFGFLFNMRDHDTMVKVVEVETIVQARWFKEALRLDFDAILVLAHMGAEDALVKVLTSSIRESVGDSIPIQFVTGHTHRRKTYRPDAASFSVEAGRYLDTVGFVSFPTKATLAEASNSSNLFKHVFVDATKEILASTIGTSELPTEEGAALSNFIQRTREELGLLEVIGCVKHNYYLGHSLDKPDSLWRLFRDDVVPTLYSGKEVFLLGKFGFRYDIIKGDVTLDNVLAVSPFNESFMVLEDIPGEVILELNASIQTNNDFSCVADLPDYIMSATMEIEANNTYDLVTDLFEVAQIHSMVSEIDESLSDLVPFPLPDGTTSTSIWLDYLHSKPECSASSSGNNHHHTHIPGSGADSSTRHHSAPDPEHDRLMLILVGIALAIVAFLAVVHVRGRARKYREYAVSQHELTLEALHEYEEEGRFV